MEYVTAFGRKLTIDIQIHGSHVKQNKMWWDKSKHVKISVQIL